jgi:hypothetical protein
MNVTPVSTGLSANVSRKIHGAGEPIDVSLVATLIYETVAGILRTV